MKHLKQVSRLFIALALLTSLVVGLTTVSAQEQIRLAREYGCRRIQFRRDNCTPQDVADAKRAGLIVNYFWSDDPSELNTLRDWGVDAVLTNDIGAMRPK